MTTVMHAHRKAELVKRLFSQIGWQKVPVYEGTGGTKEDYDDIPSTKAARTYPRKGVGLLKEEKLKELNSAAHSSDKAAKKIRELLRQSESEHSQRSRW